MLKLEYVSEGEAAGRAEDVGGPPVWVHRVHLGEAVEVLHKFPECRQLVRAVRGRIGGAEIISMNKYFKARIQKIRCLFTLVSRSQFQIFLSTSSCISLSFHFHIS